MEDLNKIAASERDDGGNLAAAQSEWGSLKNAENPIFNKAESSEEKRDLLNKVETIKDPLNKDLATAMLGHATKSREKGEEYGRIVDGLLSKYDENNGSMLDFIMKEKDAAGFGSHHNGYEVELGAAGDDNLAYLRLSRLGLGSRAQEELNTEDKSSFYIGVYHFGPIFEDASDGGRGQAAIRLMAHDIMKKYDGDITPENDSKISEDDRLSLSILSKSSYDFEGNIDRFMRQVVDDTINEVPRDGAYKFMSDPINVLSKCAKIANELDGIKDAHDVYTKALNKGKDILANTSTIEMV